MVDAVSPDVFPAVQGLVPPPRFPFCFPISLLPPYTLGFSLFWTLSPSCTSFIYPRSSVSVAPPHTPDPSVETPPFAVVLLVLLQVFVSYLVCRDPLFGLQCCNCPGARLTSTVPWNRSSIHTQELAKKKVHGSLTGVPPHSLHPVFEAHSSLCV